MNRIVSLLVSEMYSGDVGVDGHYNTKLVHMNVSTLTQEKNAPV